MQSDIKIYGPQISETLERLRDLSNTLSEHPFLKSRVFSSGRTVIGSVDFVFRWKTEPIISELLDLVSLIDNSLTGLNSRYTITTKIEGESVDTDKILKSAPEVAYSFFKFYGPSISAAIKGMNDLTEKIPVLFKSTFDSHLTLIGDFDYALKWIRVPTAEEIVMVLAEVDKALAFSGVWYKVTTKGHLFYKKEVPEIQVKIEEIKREAHLEARKATRHI